MHKLHCRSCVMTLKRSIGLDRRLFILVAYGTWLNILPTVLGHSVLQVMLLGSLQCFILAKVRRLIHVMTTVQVLLLGPTGKVVVAKHSARHNILVYPFTINWFLNIQNDLEAGLLNKRSCDVGGSSSNWNNTERSPSSCCKLDNSSFGLIPSQLVSQLRSPVGIALSTVSIAWGLRSFDG